MSIWDDLYIINEAKSAKQLVSEMSQEISMKPKKTNKSDNDKASDKKSSNTDDLFADNEFEDKKLNKDADKNGDGKVSDSEALDDAIDDIEDEEDDLDNIDGDDGYTDENDDNLDDIEGDIPDDISDEDLDNMDMDDELANSDTMMDDMEDDPLTNSEVEESDEDKTREIHLLSCVNQLYDVAVQLSKKVASLDDFPSDNINKLIRLLEFYREYRFDNAKPEDVENVIKSSTKILKSLAEKYNRIMRQQAAIARKRKGR